MTSQDEINCTICDNIFFLPIITNCCETTCCSMCLRKMIKDGCKCSKCGGKIRVKDCTDNSEIQKVLDKMRPKWMGSAKGISLSNFPHLRTKLFQLELRKEEFFKNDELVSFFVRYSSNRPPYWNGADDSSNSNSSGSDASGLSVGKNGAFKRGYRCGSTRTIAFLKVLMINKFNVDTENMILNFYCQGTHLTDNMTLRTVAYRHYSNFAQKMIIHMTILPKRKTKQQEGTVDVMEDEPVEVPPVIDADVMPMLEAEEPQTDTERDITPPPELGRFNESIPAPPMKTPIVPPFAAPVSSSSSSAYTIPSPSTSTVSAKTPSTSTPSATSSATVRPSVPLVPPPQPMDPRLAAQSMMLMNQIQRMPLNYSQVGPREMAMMFPQGIAFMNQAAFNGAVMNDQLNMMNQVQYQHFMIQNREDMRKLHPNGNGMMNQAAINEMQANMNRMMRQNSAGTSSAPKVPKNQTPKARTSSGSSKPPTSAAQRDELLRNDFDERGRPVIKLLPKTSALPDVVPPKLQSTTPSASQQNTGRLMQPNTEKLFDDKGCRILSLSPRNVQVLNPGEKTPGIVQSIKDAEATQKQMIISNNNAGFMSRSHVPSSSKPAEFTPTKPSEVPPSRNSEKGSPSTLTSARMPTLTVVESATPMKSSEMPQLIAQTTSSSMVNNREIVPSKQQPIGVKPAPISNRPNQENSSTIFPNNKTTTSPFTTSPPSTNVARKSLRTELSWAEIHRIPAFMLPKYRSGYRNPKCPNVTYDVDAIKKFNSVPAAPINQNETTYALENYFIAATSANIAPTMFLNDYYNYDKMPTLDENLTDEMVEKFVTHQHYKCRGVVIPEMEAQHQSSIFNQMFRKHSLHYGSSAEQIGKKRKSSVAKDVQKPNETKNGSESKNDGSEIEAKRIKKSEISAYVVSTPLYDCSSPSTMVKIGSNGEKEKSSRSTSSCSPRLERNDSVEIINVSTPSTSGDEESNNSDGKKNGVNKPPEMIDALTMSVKSSKTLGQTLAESMRRTPTKIKPTLQVPTVPSLNSNTQ